MQKFVDHGLKVIQRYPSFFTQAEALDIERPVDKAEIECILKGFAKYKSPSSDGETVGFFLALFYLVADDLLVVVEQSRSEGYISKALNVTFLSLIPKGDKPISLQIFHPISLCNLVYKVISKVIANQIKLKFTEVLSKKQFGLLGNRQIIEAVRITQECMHTIKLKNMEALILKVDLIKAYHRVNWGFLRLLLFNQVCLLLPQIGLWLLCPQPRLTFQFFQFFKGFATRVTTFPPFVFNGY